MSIRYGRIGDPGQLKTTTYPTTPRPSPRPRRRSARRSARATPPPSSASAPEARRHPPRNHQRPLHRQDRPAAVEVQLRRPAPSASSSTTALLVGNEARRRLPLNHDGQVRSQFRLPDGVKCIVADDDWLYAGCDDGNVYDLSGKVPRVAYEIAATSTSTGSTSTTACSASPTPTAASPPSTTRTSPCGAAGQRHPRLDGALRRRRRVPRPRQGRDHLRLGRRQGDLAQPPTGAVLFGWQEATTVYAGTATRGRAASPRQGGPSRQLPVRRRRLLLRRRRRRPVRLRRRHSSSVYCFDDDGTRLWKLGTGCGSAFSMQYHNERLYIVTTDGSLACIDASEQAIRAAEQGIVPEVVDVKAPRMEAAAPRHHRRGRPPTPAAASSSSASRRAAALRVRVVRPATTPTGRSSSPRASASRAPATSSTEVREASRGGFYRAYGDIRRLV